MSSLRIGFIGAGNMAQALAKGMVSSGVTTANNIIASSPKTDQPLLDKMKDMGCQITFDNRDATVNSDVTILAVKPNIVKHVLTDIREIVSTKGPLIASVAMGVSLSHMEKFLSPGCRVMRCMPNTPALLQVGASVYCRGTHATDEDAAIVNKILTSVGDSHLVPEHYLNAVTGLSGAGPAYVYMIIEALADGGVKAGLPRVLATKLAAQTLLGGAQMILQTGLHPGQLKDAVCSPGGCTIAGVAAMEAAGVRGGIMRAVGDATSRSIDMEQDMNL